MAQIITVEVDEGVVLNEQQVRDILEVGCTVAKKAFAEKKCPACGAELLVITDRSPMLLKCSRASAEGPCFYAHYLFKEKSAVEIAREKKVCRICGKPGDKFEHGDFLVFNFGREYAHQSCLKKEKA